MDKRISGFRAAGIWPIDPNKFSDNDFSLTDVVDDSTGINTDEIKHKNYSTNTKQKSNGMTEQEPGSARCTEAGHRTPPRNSESQSNQRAEPQPGTSRSAEPVPYQASFSSKVSIEKLAPLPGPAVTKTTKSRPKQHSEIYTSTSIKAELEIREEKRNRKKQDENLKKSGVKPGKRKAQKVEQASAKAKKRYLSKKSKIRHLHLDDSESESWDESQLCDDDELDDVDITEDSELCLVCGEFGQDNEIWYRCVICSKWAHEDCSGWDSPVGYTCDMCVKIQKK
ncbi:hypothetical protein MTP99_006880 [Tenebrio molitor]|jgi:hypothetical protein|nr:hypothetical protein MTP99_006880 [Tenebrio molitor]